MQKSKCIFWDDIRFYQNDILFHYIPFQVRNFDMGKHLDIVQRMQNILKLEFQFKWILLNHAFKRIFSSFFFITNTPKTALNVDIFLLFIFQCLFLSFIFKCHALEIVCFC